MPLFRALDEGGSKGRPWRKMEGTGGRRSTHDEGSVLSLTQMCLLSLAENMKEVWAKDYADNYLDHYTFRYIMGPFNALPGDLVEELTWLLSSRKQLSRAALHLLLVPQLRGLSLEGCPGLVTSALCAHISARCQGLWSLDLSGAQHLPPKVLSETLSRLPALRSLSLAGVPCDRSVIRTVVSCCRMLRHLDVSRCHCLSPAALLPLGAPFPLPLRSLLAMDIGFGEQEADAAAAAAYLLLSLPYLERVAMEDLAQACLLIEQREFSQADVFADRERVPRLEEVWKGRIQGQGRDSWGLKTEGAPADKKAASEEEERAFCVVYDCESEEGAVNDEEPSCSHNQPGLILPIKDVKGVTCDSLDSLGHLCPGISSISVNVDKSEDTSGRSLASGLQMWSGQLQSLSVQFPGPLGDLLFALQVAGPSLVSLTLEGVKSNPHSPLLEIIEACPRLRNLHISAEPPSTEQEYEDPPQDQDPPQLPQLCSLTLSFSYEHNQMKPSMLWPSLEKVLRGLLSGCPLLEKLSLVSLPCPVDLVLQQALHRADSDMLRYSNSPCPPPVTLGRVRHVDLLRTDVQMKTVKRLMQHSKRLKFVDVSYCWNITHLQWLECKRLSKAQIVWM
ncbi:unnamed protein product [Menidia menidia]|uniref:(Atlantic silverside) hypothetical protein n=1 Tax=Menidia menidia TaxID=238744 RepID=A0A8S4AXP5_9TELE|nr:unnamed protein product [Menidia menidia]